MPDLQIEPTWHFRMRVVLALAVVEILVFGCAALALLPFGLSTGGFSTPLFIVGAVVVVIGIFMQRSRIESLEPNAKPVSEFLPVVVLIGGGIAVASSIILGLI